MSHVREARLLCRKTVDLFTLLSRPQDTTQRRSGMTQELLALVTGLAHYLKILIRIALTGSLKLERDHDFREAMINFLDKLHLLAVEGGNPGARRIIRGGSAERGGQRGGGATGTQGVTYGFKSLAPANAGESPFAESSEGAGPSTERLSLNPPSDLCIRCNSTVEEDCARLGTYQRWHAHCLKCDACGKASAPLNAKDPPPPSTSMKDTNGNADDKDTSPPKISSARRPPANVDIFVYDSENTKDSPYGPIPITTFCLEHQRGACRGGFEPVSRLEQYSFLLNVALRRLSYLLKRRGVLLPVTRELFKYCYL